MSDIKKGYTFTDKSTDWASNKDTAIRLNKMMDEAEVNLVAGTNVTITPTINGPRIDVAGSGTGTVTSIDVDGGTGISVSPAGPITTSGTFTVTNTAPDQTVVLTGAGTTAITGTYPNFTVTSNDAYVGTVTSVSAAAGTGITVSGSPITSSGTITITNSAPDKTVVLTQGGTTTITGTYPNFSISSADQYTGTVTSVSGAGGGTGLTLSGGPITGSGTLTLGGTLNVANGGTGTSSPSLVAGTNVTITGTWPNQTINSTAGGGGGGTVTSIDVDGGTGISVSPAGPITTSGTFTVTNTAPDQTVSITSGTGISASGTYPNFTVTNTAPDQTVAISAGTNISVSGTYPNFTVGSTAVAIPTTGSKYSRLRKDITGTISASSNMSWAGPDVFNVKDYGAVGDGSTDDTTAIGNAIDAAITARGKLYFPASIYVISDTITKTFGTVNTFYGLSIYGDGIGCSIIKQSGSNKGVFNLTCAGRSGCLTIEGLGFWNNSGLSTAPCIKYSVSQEDNNDSHPNLRANNLFIGAQSGGNSWTIGLDLYNIHNGYISGVQYYGDLSAGGTGIVFQKYGSNTTAGTNKSMACFIQGSQFNLCNTGVKVKDAMESCLIQQCLMVGVKYGVNADYCIHLSVVNSHINCNDGGLGGTCIYGSGTGSDGGRFDQFICQGNLIYSQDTNTTGINAGLNRSSINGNSFVCPQNATGTRGIVVTGGDGNTICGNSFSWHKTSYIELGSNTSLVSSNNATKGTGLATNQYVDTGSGNNLVNNYYQT